MFWMKKRKSRTRSGERRRPSNLAQRGRRERGNRSRLLRGITVVVGVTVLAAVPLALAAKKKPPPTRTIRGEVLDAADNPLVGAAVELKDTQTGKTVAIYSDAGGRYEFAGLRPTHDYEVSASYKGGHSEVRRASSLDDRAIFVLNLTIPPAASQ